MHLCKFMPRHGTLPALRRDWQSGLALQADSLEDVQQRLEELGIAYVKQVILEGGVQVPQASPIWGGAALVILW